MGCEKSFKPTLKKFKDGIIAGITRSAVPTDPRLFIFGFTRDVSLSGTWGIGVEFDCCSSRFPLLERSQSAFQSKSLEYLEDGDNG